MTVAYRRSPSRGLLYEDGVQLEFAYPDFDTPDSSLTFLRNPPFGSDESVAELAQSQSRSPTGRITAASIADGTTWRHPFSWSAMKIGWSQGQRVSGTATVEAFAAGAASTTDYLVSFGFRSFDGTAPSSVVVAERTVVDAPITTTAVTIAGSDLYQYPQGRLVRKTTQITTTGTTAKIGIIAASTGQDFLITDLHAMKLAAGTDLWDETDDLADSNQDGVGDAWSLTAGSAAGCSHYGEDAAGLKEWIRLVSDGALNTFEVRLPGGGDVVTVRLASPTSGIGWPLQPGGVYSGVGFELVEDA